MSRPKNARAVNSSSLLTYRISMVNAVDIPRCGGTAKTGRIGLMLMKKVGAENLGPQNNSGSVAKAIDWAVCD
jgi:hypothetical protein